MKNLKILPRFSDGLSFVYLEHAVIERADKSVAAFTSEGRISLPASGLACLMLGPGTRVTHAAVNTLSDNGAVIVWVGEDGLRFYASGFGKTRSSSNLVRQAMLCSDPKEHGRIVRRLFEMRFGDPIPVTMSLQQIRGREGARVRDAYRAASEKSGVEWNGRNYDRDKWENSDPINRALSAANSALYAVCLAGLVSAGYSPALGFIHVGKQLSFVFDLADLYKLELVVPAAFEAASEGADDIEKRARTKFRERAHEAKLLARVITDLKALFDEGGEGSFEEDVSLPGRLWDGAGKEVEGGKRYDSFSP